MNCWEFMECGREDGGINSSKLGICPSYPDKRKCCARVSGTLCGGELQGTFAIKLINCMECKYYKSEYYERKMEKCIKSVVNS